MHMFGADLSKSASAWASTSCWYKPGYLKGAADDDVLTFAAEQGRVLLTSNAQDFAPLAVDWFLAGREHWGIVIVPGQTNESRLSRALENLVRDYPAESLKNTYRFISEFE